MARKLVIDINYPSQPPDKPDSKTKMRPTVAEANRLLEHGTLGDAWSPQARAAAVAARRAHARSSGGASTPEYNRGYKHGEAGHKPESQHPQYVAGHKYGSSVGAAQRENNASAVRFRRSTNAMGRHQ